MSDDFTRDYGVNDTPRMPIGMADIAAWFNQAVSAKQGLAEARDVIKALELQAVGLRERNQILERSNSQLSNQMAQLTAGLSTPKERVLQLLQQAMEELGRINVVRRPIEHVCNDCGLVHPPKMACRLIQDDLDEDDDADWDPSY